MTSVRDRLADVDRELEALAPAAVADRGRGAATRGSLLDLGRVDAELATLASTRQGRDVILGGAARPATSTGASPSGESTLDVGDLFGDVKPSEMPPLGAGLAELVRSIEPRNQGETRVPVGRDGAIDLAELLEGESEHPPADTPIVLDDE